MRHVNAILKKQMKETVKNAPVLIQFIMFPAMTLIMNHAVHIEEMPQNYFVPLMMIFSFLPMLSMFNTQIEKIGKFIYTVQLQNMILNLQSLELKPSVVVILAGNMLVAACLFVFAYRKSEFA